MPAGPADRPVHPLESLRHFQSPAAAILKRLQEVLGSVERFCQCDVCAIARVSHFELAGRDEAELDAIAVFVFHHFADVFCPGFPMLFRLIGGGASAGQPCQERASTGEGAAGCFSRDCLTESTTNDIRKPRLRLRFVGTLARRGDDPQLYAESPQWPPRSTRWGQA